MYIASGPLRVTIKYVEERASTCIFQRGIRLALRERYGGKKKIAIDLKTKDPAKVARLVAQLNAQLEAEWDALEQDPQRTPRAVSLPGGSPKLSPADALLDRWGLKPLAPGQDAGTHDPMALELLHDHFDSKREAFAAGAAGTTDAERAYREAHPSDYLNAVEAAAWRRLHVPPVDTVRDVLRVYLDTDPKQGPKAAKFQSDATAQFNDLIAVIGDKAVTDVVRADAHAFVKARLVAPPGKPKGDATSTVRRKLNTFVAAWHRYRRECLPTLPNPFEALPIPNEGADRKKRVPFTVTQLETDAAVYAFPRYNDGQDCKTTAASNALLGWVGRTIGAGLNHELRHALKDRLRAVRCPKDVNDSITGHTSQDVGDGYGLGYSLEAKREWLLKVALPWPGGEQC